MQSNLLCFLVLNSVSNSSKISVPLCHSGFHFQELFLQVKDAKTDIFSLDRLWSRLARPSWYHRELIFNFAPYISLGTSPLYVDYARYRFTEPITTVYCYGAVQIVFGLSNCVKKHFEPLHSSKWTGNALCMASTLHGSWLALMCECVCKYILYISNKMGQI